MWLEIGFYWLSLKESFWCGFLGLLLAHSSTISGMCERKLPDVGHKWLYVDWESTRRYRVSHYDPRQLPPPQKKIRKALSREVKHVNRVFGSWIKGRFENFEILNKASGEGGKSEARVEWFVEWWNVILVNKETLKNKKFFYIINFYRKRM